jgi:hypothetical protein
MSKGSLDKWIFNKTYEFCSIERRQKIIIDIAKELTYLYEDCRQKIIHLISNPKTSC